MVSPPIVKNILNNYIKQKGLVDHQIKSYNDFITHGINEIICADKIKIRDGLNIYLSNPITDKPHVYECDRTLKDLYPNESRQRDLTYSCNIYVTVTIENVPEKTESVHHRILLCELPCMLMSQYCHLHRSSLHDKVNHTECEYDDGGYFIIRGKERVLIPQIRSVYNIPTIYEKVDGRYTCEVRSISETTGHSVLVKMFLNTANNKITILLPYMKKEIPLGIILTVLNLTDYDSIRRFVGMPPDSDDKYKEILYKIILETLVNVDTTNENIQTMCYKYIAFNSMCDGSVIQEEKYIQYAEQIIETELLPHLGSCSSKEEKGYFICFMLKQLILTATGARQLDDRDNYANKRVESAGMLCYDLFRQFYRKYKDSLLNILDKKKTSTDIPSIISKLNIITKGFIHCFGTGNWGVPKTSYIRPGVSQVLSRLSYGAGLSHKRRLSIPIGKESKNTQIRQINPSQIGFICPCETPEGQSVGIVLNLTLFSSITVKKSVSFVIDVIERTEYFISTDKINQCSLDEYVIIFVNGIICGFTNHCDLFMQCMEQLKINNVINRQISAVLNRVDNCITVSVDAGRLVRPVFTLCEDGKLRIHDKLECYDWDYLIEHDYIRYIDVIEANNSVIAFYPEELTKYRNKYCEISPNILFGVMGSIIPWPDHSQSPRNCYQASMGKQAMSMYSLTYNTRKDTMSHVLGYPQKPLVSTFLSGAMGFDDMPSGINAIVAIGCYTGYNQEDSIIVNQSAIERGLFGATSFRTHVHIEKRSIGDHDELFGCPSLNIRKTDANYALLDTNGIVKKRFLNGAGVYVKKNDVIIGSTIINHKKHDNDHMIDNSVIIKKGEEGYIDQVDLTTTPDGYTMVKIVIRQERIPEVGDKAASRSAQKGTIGMVYRQEDMPWTDNGMVPDLIINPNCIPSRMTINQLMESVLGKSCCMEGVFGDATPFESPDGNIAAQLRDRLQLNSFSGSGTEVLYNGFTGEAMGEFFIGPVYYQRLKHLVKDKIHARSTGPVTTLTKQPLEGRSRDGGLRFGEMERDCTVSHGTSKFLIERLCEQSDPYSIPVCDKCGVICNNHETCNVCIDSEVNDVDIPYISKLVLQELNSMSLKTKIES